MADATWRNDVLEFIKTARRAARVKRYHTEPIIGEQTVGQHCHGVAVLCYILCDRHPPQNLMLAAVFHDFEEHLLGDLPSPAKALFGDGFRNIYQHRQQEVYDASHLSHVFKYLTDDDKAVLKWADALELVLFCIEQIRLGNTNMRKVLRCIQQISQTYPAHPRAKNLFDHLTKGALLCR